MMEHNEQMQVADGMTTLLRRVRERHPLIHHITNLVVMNDTANVTLAIGASPVMAHALEEVEEMVNLADCLLLNIGTLTVEQVEAMVRAGKRANERGIPIVLDPVGAGATSMRTESALRLLRELRIAVIRGNASEIGALIGVEAQTRGVDAHTLGEEREVVVRRAAQAFGCSVAMTGTRDLVSDGTRLASVDNGHSFLAAITGSGCMSTTMVAAFLAIEVDACLASIVALSAFGIAGEIAAERAGGPGTFRSHLLDAIAALDEATMIERQKVSTK
nr:hydroxyethylthiazole kinase [Ktedonobacter sp. SOSP1-85]